MCRMVIIGGGEDLVTLLIFTYGTLKRGFSNHGLLLDLIDSGDATYIGDYRTAEKLPLVCGPYKVPFLLNLPGAGDCVQRWRVFKSEESEGEVSSAISFDCKAAMGTRFYTGFPNWESVDLGGTEIDMRFSNPKEGRLSVIVAPVKRFSNGLGEDVDIEQIGPPEKVINAFGPEVIGENVEGKVSAKVVEHSGRKYYQFKLESPHVLITATASGNCLYLFSVTGNGLQWKRHCNDLNRIAQSFRVV